MNMNLATIFPFCWESFGSHSLQQLPVKPDTEVSKVTGGPAPRRLKITMVHSCSQINGKTRSTGSPFVDSFPEAKRESGEIAGLELRGMTASMFWTRGSAMVRIRKAPVLSSLLNSSRTSYIFASKANSKK